MCKTVLKCCVNCSAIGEIQWQNRRSTVKLGLDVCHSRWILHHRQCVGTEQCSKFMPVTNEKKRGRFTSSKVYGTSTLGNSHSNRRPRTPRDLVSPWLDPCRIAVLRWNESSSSLVFSVECKNAMTCTLSVSHWTLQRGYKLCFFSCSFARQPSLDADE